jgi:acyl-CoA reductase-like NAD-dependent aldehyde dehydrogenase
MKQQILNPFNDEVVGEVAIFSEADVAACVETTSAFKREFANMPAHQKASILTKTATLIDEQQEDLARLIVLESGKPIRYARGEVKRAVETFTFAADEARRLRGETIRMDAATGGVGKFGYYIRVPVGVVAAITPFNFPLNLVAHKVAPAIAAGCPIVLKPAPTTPLTAMRLRDLMLKAGLPPSAYQVVTGDADVGRWLTTSPLVDMITFTGSPAVARRVSEIAQLRKITFELGGNAGVIIDEGTPITDDLINRLVVGSFAYSGQVCISVQRIYAHISLMPDLKSKLIARTKALVVGNPLDDATEIGPLINKTASERIRTWLDDSIAVGAQVLVGGAANGRMFEPTIVENVPDDANLMCAEVFGPVVNLIEYDDFEDALTAVDDSEFGLQAGVYTPNLAKTMRAVERLNVGGVIINDVPTFRVDHMPYGGNKNSGVGREGPQFAIDDMTEIKMVVINV